jgi:hypothetical protein
VSQYECEGAFSHRQGEWDVTEVAQAGCSCTAIDPNQPATWSQACEPSASDCQAPLECLQLETVDVGFPSLPRFACTAACATDADCPTWQATGFCAGPVRLRCAGGSCQLRSCE